MNNRIITIIVAVLAAGGIAACGSATTTKTVTRTTAPPKAASDTAAAQASASSTTESSTTSYTPPPATPHPQGQFDSSCDITLADSIDGPNYFIGRADMNNTGNIGIVVRVTAEWDQTSEADIHATPKYVRIPRGQSRTARFSVPATQDQISQMQDSPSYMGSGNGCKIGVKIVDTFGLPKD